MALQLTMVHTRGIETPVTSNKACMVPLHYVCTCRFGRNPSKTSRELINVQPTRRWQALDEILSRHSGAPRQPEEVGLSLPNACNPSLTHAPFGPKEAAAAIPLAGTTSTTLVRPRHSSTSAIKGGPVYPKDWATSTNALI